MAIGIAITCAVVSGLASWAVGDRWNGWLTLLHGTAGLTLLLLIPAKLRGSARTGIRRNRPSRWLSIMFGMLVLATIGLGTLHATGLWFGVGQWSALWTHELLGFASIPFLIWHVASRPRRARPTVDLDRRALLGVGALGATVLVGHVAQRSLAGTVGLAGGTRRSTGSHEIASHDPDNMPSVIWLNDRRPASTDSDTWPLTIQVEPVTIEALRVRSRPVTATLDCTGGWYSVQRWDAVAVSELIDRRDGRSVRIESSTGYTRRFPIGDLDDLYLAVGYDGKTLRSGHGAPVRLVVPGRRGPEWIKWVTRVDLDDRPSWLQPPLPLS